jgi:hypothetical protein
MNANVKEGLKIVGAGTLIVSGIVGAILLLFVGQHQVVGSVMLGVPCIVLFGGLATQ